MIKLKWLKPFDKTEEIDDIQATNWIISKGDFVNSLPLSLYREQGWIHLIKDYIDIIIWDTDKVGEETPNG